MTSFSIQKTLFFAVLGCLLGFGYASPSAHAQSDSLQQEIKKADDRIKDHANQQRIEAESQKSTAPLVVELFTAPDCSACVYADRMLYDTIQAHSNVIGLSCYIHEKAAGQGDQNQDGAYRTLNSKSDQPLDGCLFRQWVYLGMGRELGAYLRAPEFIIAGHEKVGAGELKEFDKTVSKYINYNNQNHTQLINMRWKNAKQILITLPEEDAKEARNFTNSSVWLIRYRDIVIEKVNEGPNAGKVLRFSNVIQNIRHVAKWHGQSRELLIDVPTPASKNEAGGYVAIIQDMMGEEIRAAGQLKDQ